jgi:hypothetical protein
MLNDTLGIPEHIEEAPTTKICDLEIRPYTIEEHCQCGAVAVNIDPAKLRVITTRTRIYIVRCPSCPRS